jgi:cytochrome b561
MKTIKPTIAAAEVVLIFPAVLFMTSLFVRELQPIQYEPAHTAQRIVDWYAARVHLGLWVLLIALPLTVTATGCAMLLRAWRENAELRQTARQTIAAIRAHPATLFVAAATLAAGGILAIVALHMLTD